MRENYYALFLAIVKGYSTKQAFAALHRKEENRKHRKKPDKHIQCELDLQGKEIA